MPGGHEAQVPALGHADLGIPCSKDPALARVLPAYAGPDRDRRRCPRSTPSDTVTVTDSEHTPSPTTTFYTHIASELGTGRPNAHRLGAYLPVYRFGVAMGGADLGPGCGPAFALGADHAPDVSSFGHVGAVLDLSRHAVALAGVQRNGGCPATETRCGRAVRCGLGGIQACRAEQQRTPKRSREARWNFTGVLLRG
jgi:hypothetical protein